MRKVMEKDKLKESSAEHEILQWNSFKEGLEPPAPETIQRVCEQFRAAGLETY